MAEKGTPHFHNNPGVSTIHVGAKEFMCIGATPPLDHPHIFLDMGTDDEIICSYCSTLYKYDPSLKPNEARPAECVWVEESAETAAR
ncbi:zinc-finger domain-containing protein [Microvirga flavescens]|uniref:zinc-finger domain-containing protein n=1 Tax=Microvirga flavescens TaxID=2249811 RepID=UPI000DD57E30|nr:zinc-finger domain-containing protein [Microvirga flavescens]